MKRTVLAVVVAASALGAFAAETRVEKLGDDIWHVRVSRDGAWKDSHMKRYGIVADLRVDGVRVEVDDSDDRMQKKIRNATRQKVPFMLIAGESDRAAGAVSFRFRDGSQFNGVDVGEAVDRIVGHIAARANEDPTAPGQANSGE